MQVCQVDTEAACLQICLTNKYLPEDRQGTSACQDSGEDLKKQMLKMEPLYIRCGLCPVLRSQW